MLLLLIFLVLLAIAGKMFFGMALEVIGLILGLTIVLIVFIVRRKRR